MKITSVRNKALKKIVRNPTLTAVKGLDPFVFRVVSEQVTAIKVMTNPHQLIELFPQWRAHELKPGQPNVWSLKVTGNWRLTFLVDLAAQEVSLLDLVDYH